MSLHPLGGYLCHYLCIDRTDTEVFMNQAVPRIDSLDDYLCYKHKFKDQASLMLSYFLDNREKIARC